MTRTREKPFRIAFSRVHTGEMLSLLRLKIALRRIE
jgi:hypothetical protein